MTCITKHLALETALLLNASGEFRTYLVKTINRAYAEYTLLPVEELCQRLDKVSKNDNSELLAELLHYMTCMRIESMKRY